MVSLGVGDVELLPDPDKRGLPFGERPAVWFGVRGEALSDEPRPLVEPMRGVPVDGVLLRVDGVRDDGMRLEGLVLDGLRLLVLGVADIEGIRLVFEPELAFVGTRRYMFRSDELVFLEEPPTGFTV